MIQHSYLSNAEVSALDDLYQKYREDKNAVDFGWQKFFEGFDLASGKDGLENQVLSDDMRKEINVLNLINGGYRMRGHLFTKTNPVRERRKYSPDLALENFGLEKSDLEKTFNAGVEIGMGPAKLKDIIAKLEKTYCGHIGAEYMYILEPEKRLWLQSKMEGVQNTPDFSIEEKREILDKLNRSVVFENFLHTKYVGQKRFSLEGLETLIPALSFVIEYGAGLEVEEFLLGMAHRGRLNVLANILNKTYEEIFSEFEGKAYRDAIFEGDVKYHLGFSGNIKTKAGKEVRLTLCPNPSHLESVNPVVKGVARAKMDRKFKGVEDKITPILIHGDASVAGQGIVYEVLQMAGLKGYKVGGTMHIVTNNQIGFTTNYLDARSSIYCTDIAKVTKCPVFHVNADNAEAVVYTVKLAMEYRQKFNSDVFIDLLGYRKYGHNEGDEPRFTQPLLYKALEKHPNPREIYSQKLAEGQSIEAELAKEMEKKFKNLLQEKLDWVRTEGKYESTDLVKTNWKDYRKAESKDFEKSPETGVKKAVFKKIAEKITDIPADNLPIKKVQKIFADRKAMIENDRYDWAMGELMAYATLLDEGFNVRMSGQDCERGTFSHRHAVIKKEDTEREYVPLKNIAAKQGNFEIYNSLLSEFAVLGYEYGYAMASPKSLTIWEAQFGDFVNGAQVIIDQYISSGETKWRRFNGLVMLLPHGHEGQGPEHSSARPERFLQLSATNNMQVVNITTPANLFHALRRQMHRDIRVPLIIMTPKSLLRHPLCVSKKEDFTKGSFQQIIDDPEANEKKVKRVLLCTGKIYFDLLERKNLENRTDIALVRLEQLYPIANNQIASLAKKYEKAEFVWVQEEPKNMGTWQHLLRYEFPFQLRVISRKSSSTPATGYAKVHAAEQEEIIKNAFS